MFSFDDFFTGANRMLCVVQCGVVFKATSLEEAQEWVDKKRHGHGLTVMNYDLLINNVINVKV